jgi:hypothetical protein
MRTRKMLPTALVLLLWACNFPTSDVSTRSAEVIVPPAATHTKYARGNGAEEAAFNLQVEYPASEFLEGITQTLQDLGWTPSETLYDNPGIATGQVGGWSRYTDPSANPALEIRQWIGEWKNSNGDVMTYSLRYVSPSTNQLAVSIHRRAKSSI